ncbi:MAG: recombinase family protein, partial [Usitatibacteraceae bacterium]
MVKTFDSRGEPVRGDRTINDVQADVIRRIFRDYAAGKSAKRIAFELNKEGFAAPGGGDWGFSTINGNVKRGNGILNNEMYVGKLVWNRQRFIKDPDSGKRQARPNPESEWIIQDVPELCIL